MAQKNQVETLAKKIFSLLAIPVDLTVAKQNEGWLISVKMENPALLIGFHGETLTGLQLVLSLMVYRQLGEWVRLTVDVDGYLQRRREILEKMALTAAQRVRFSQKPYSLPPMNARERRIIHLILADAPDVQTESQGEEPQRGVVVQLK
ncbi:hypothetical protein COU97_01105 [Candidatus Shapirobacteria bacterium CG10_big_fil_rev_8_21_14_0_10_48_15]|uniref:R3H domain-containing protein n=1 Tax=Candidatus Shapirobacteria bacterium CG10_big_fil_rev_8_21_14_0_10_48_15 TaxID=1974484 RepID=A0A2M8L7F7_9BACT|nr:MAG: hypothetical protein COU97_01105 [Candidatus Shapirobacteria bacterium CG10_big_fil_rev_8_21_14_0_10_48_15]